jgi:hypothetical protein
LTSSTIKLLESFHNNDPNTSKRAAEDAEEQRPSRRSFFRTGHQTTPLAVLRVRLNGTGRSLDVGLHDLSDQSVRYHYEQLDVPTRLHYSIFGLRKISIDLRTCIDISISAVKSIDF